MSRFNSISEQLMKEKEMEMISHMITLEKQFTSINLNHIDPLGYEDPFSKLVHIN